MSGVAVNWCCKALHHLSTLVLAKDNGGRMSTRTPTVHRATHAILGAPIDKDILQSSKRWNMT